MGEHLCWRPAKKKRLYIATSSHIDPAHAQNYRCETKVPYRHDNDSFRHKTGSCYDATICGHL